MKKSLLINLTLLFALNGYAQTADTLQIATGPTFLGKHVVKTIVIGTQNGNSYYLYRNFGAQDLRQGFTIRKFNPELNLIKEKLILLPTNRRSAYFVKCFFLDSRLFLIYSFDNKSTKKLHIIAQSVNAESLMLEDDEYLLFTCETDRIKGYDAADIQLSFSPDSNNIVLSVVSFSAKMGVYPVIDIASLQKDFHLNWTKFNVNYLYSGEGRIIESQITDKGNVWLYFKNFSGINTDSMEKEVNHKLNNDITSYHLIHLCESDKPRRFDLNIEGHSVSYSCIRTIKGSESILCTGLYALYGQRSPIGVFAHVLGTKEDSLVNINSLLNFSPDFIAGLASTRQRSIVQRKMDDGEEFDNCNYTCSKLIEFSDSVYIVGMEQDFFAIQRNAKHSTRVYQKRNVLFVFVNNEGEIQTLIKLPKYQSTNNISTYNGYTWQLYNESILIAYTSFDFSIKSLTMAGKTDIKFAVINDEHELIYPEFYVEVEKIAIPEFEQAIWVNNVVYFNSSNWLKKPHPSKATFNFN